MTTLRVFIGLIFVLALATAQVQLRGTLATDGNPTEFMVELRPSGAATTTNPVKSPYSVGTVATPAMVETQAL